MKPRHIWAVGRNYADHAKEMKAALPKEPLIFLKGGGSASSSEVISLPSWTQDVHHEIELALKFDGNLEFSEFALANDLTERHFQSEAKKSGLPWTLAKSFIGSCPISPFMPLPNLDVITNFSIELEVNGQIRQKSQLTAMIFTPEVLREYLLARFPVEPGDWLLTGTPEGVGPIRDGDRLVGRIPGQIEIHWSVRKET